MNDLIAKYKIGDVTYENISQKYSDYFKEILEFQPSVNGRIKKEHIVMVQLISL